MREDTPCCCEQRADNTRKKKLVHCNLNQSVNEKKKKKVHVYN